MNRENVAININQRDPLPVWLKPGVYILQLVQRLLGRIFPVSINPAYYLGAIIFLLFQVVLATGVYVYIFHDAAPSQAWESVRSLSEGQKYFGGIIRSIHRYSANALLIAISLHMFQVFFSDRFRRSRWLGWTLGSLALFTIWVEGVSGYLLVWDQTAQAITAGITRLLASLAIISGPTPGDLLTDEYSIALFLYSISWLHLALPAIASIIIIYHVLHISRPVINPPVPLAIAIGVILLMFALLFPAGLLPKADLTTIADVDISEWFILKPVSVADRLGPGLGWLTGMAVFALFVSLPWIIRSPKMSPSLAGISAFPEREVLVDPEKCTGCMVCIEECPFEAYSATTHEGKSVVELNQERCASCGLCIMACEDSAITMGGVNFTRLTSFAITVAQSAKAKNLAFICERSVELASALKDDGRSLDVRHDVAVIALPCLGALTPSLVEACHAAGAQNVLAIGCQPVDCHYRAQRRRIEFTQNPEQKKLLVEKMYQPYFKTIHTSRFEKKRFLKEVEKFIDIKKGAP